MTTFVEEIFGGLFYVDVCIVTSNSTIFGGLLLIQLHSLPNYIP